MHTFLLILVTIIWGSTFFIVKDAVSSVNEYFLVFGRTLIAAIVMILIILFTNKKSLLNKKAIINGSILGILLATTYISQTIGLKYTSTGHSAFITGSAVIVVPILLYLFYKEKILKSDLFSVFVVLIGLLLLTYDFNTKINIGDLITLITALAYANHVILAGKFVKNTDILAMIAYQFLTASVFSFLIFILTNQSFPVLEIKSVISITYLGFIGTLFCYFISIWVQKYVSSIKVALIFTLEPIFAAFFGYLVLRETLNIKEMTGALLILFGITLYQVLKSKFK